MSRSAVIAFFLLGACGRTPAFSSPELLVQVVDERDDALAGADVDLVTTGDEPRFVDRARTDGHGMATFEYPGNGKYLLRATGDLRCCYHEGSLEVTLLDPSRIIVLETVTGPCPTWIPTDC